MPAITIKLDLSSNLQYRIDKKLKNKKKPLEEFLYILIINLISKLLIFY